MAGVCRCWRRAVGEWLFEFVDQFDAPPAVVAAALRLLELAVAVNATPAAQVQLAALAAVLVASRRRDDRRRPLGADDLAPLAEGAFSVAQIEDAAAELEALLASAGEAELDHTAPELADLLIAAAGLHAARPFAQALVEIGLCECCFAEFGSDELATASLLCALEACSIETSRLDTRLGCPRRIEACRLMMRPYATLVFPEMFDRTAAPHADDAQARPVESGERSRPECLRAKPAAFAGAAGPQTISSRTTQPLSPREP